MSNIIEKLDGVQVQEVQGENKYTKIFSFCKNYYIIIGVLICFVIFYLGYIYCKNNVDNVDNVDNTKTKESYVKDSLKTKVKKDPIKILPIEGYKVNRVRDDPYDSNELNLENEIKNLIDKQEKYLEKINRY